MEMTFGAPILFATVNAVDCLRQQPFHICRVLGWLTVCAAIRIWNCLRQQPEDGRRVLQWLVPLGVHLALGAAVGHWCWQVWPKLPDWEQAEVAWEWARAIVRLVNTTRPEVILLWRAVQGIYYPVNTTLRVPRMANASRPEIQALWGAARRLNSELDANLTD